MKPARGFTPILIILIVLGSVVVCAGGLFAYQKYYYRNDELTPDKVPASLNQDTPDDTKSETLTRDETANWKTYNNPSANYSIKYAPNYELRENQTPSADGVWANAPGTTSILVPRTNGNFSLEISSEEIAANSTLENWSDEVKCQSATNPLNTSIAGKNALTYKDTLCGIAGKTEIYIINNNVGYKLEVSSFQRYEEYKKDLDQILSTFKFTN